MAAIVGIIGRRGLRIELCHRNYPNKSKLSLYSHSFHFNSHLKQLYISNKMEQFSYKDRCGIHGYTHIKVFKIRDGLGNRQIALGY